jgi:UDP-2-acetamido-2,6-beta-L-arabino-hexul-4-ose reductase
MHTTIEIEKKTDERGWLAEILKANFLNKKEFGQFFITTAKPGISKGNHYHTRKHEYFCVIRGQALLTLQDLDHKTKEVMKTEEIELSDRELQCIEILPWTNHIIKNTGTDEMWLLAYVDEQFDPDDPDTSRP